MSEPDQAAARAEIRARLALSREELRAVFEPPGDQAGADGSPGGGGRPGGFPRSRTIQMLLSGRGIGTLGALAMGLIVARPALALRLLRMLPASAVARMLLVRALGALRAKQ
jgi:hypothetical protein